MRLPKRGEKGFTLIELLIVVAILGVLAAVVIPNVTRFFGKGEEEAARTELHNVQTAVTNLMVDNNISSIPTPVSLETNDMSAFPDVTATAASKGADANFLSSANATEVTGFLLYGHQLIVDVDRDGAFDVGDDAVKNVNYVNMAHTAYWYRCDEDGIIHQYEPDGVGGFTEKTY